MVARSSHITHKMNKISKSSFELNFTQFPTIFLQDTFYISNDALAVIRYLFSFLYMRGTPPTVLWHLPYAPTPMRGNPATPRSEQEWDFALLLI